MRVRLGCYLCFVGWLCASALLLGGALRAQEDAPAAARRILADPRYQTEIPDGSDAAERGGAGSEEEAARARKRAEERAREGSSLLLPSEAGPELLRICAYIALGAAAVFVLLKLAVALAEARRSSQARREKHVRPPAAGARAESVRAAETGALPASQELASRGLYGEALHALLLELLRELSPQAAPGRTSRELVREIDLPPTTRPALEALAHAVERACFAGDRVEAAAWTQGTGLAESVRARGRAR